MDNLDVLLEILHRVPDLSTLEAICRSNKDTREICKRFKIIENLEIKTVKKYGGSPNGALLRASKNGDASMVKLALKRHADIHTDHDGALRNACLYGDPEIVELLVNKGADIKLYGSEALKIALWNGHDDLVEYLTEDLGLEI